MSISLRESVRPYYHAAIKKPVLTLLPPLLRHIPVSSQVVGPPKGLVVKTKDWVDQYNHSSIQPSAVYTKVHDGSSITRKPPKALDSPIHSVFSELSAQEDDTFVAAIPNGRVWGSNGAIVSPDDLLLEDVSAEYDHERYIHGRHSAFSQIRLPRVQHVAGTVAVLTTLSVEYYSHWILDVLPRAELLRLAGYTPNKIDRYYLTEPRLSYQKETLDRLGIVSSKIIDSVSHPHIQAERLLVPSLARGVFQPTAWLLDFLKSKFASVNSETTHGCGSRLYISRAQAKWRRVIKEDKVIDFLHGLGFQVIAAEMLSMLEKADVFGAADIVVSPAGSGFANMIFCKPQTKLIEIFNPAYVDTPAWLLCNALGLDYYYLRGEAHSQNIAPIKADIQVNIEHLSALLGLAGIS